MAKKTIEAHLDKVEVVEPVSGSELLKAYIAQAEAKDANWKSTKLEKKLAELRMRLR
jgi:hypothetical protein